MIKDGNRPPQNHHHHNDPLGKEGNAYELLPDRRLPCIAPPRASTRKLEVAKNETVNEWWQARFRWCGDDHLDSSWMVGDGGFFYYHGDVFNKIDSDIDMWQKRWFCQSFDKRTIVKNGRLCRKGRSHLTRNSIFVGPSARRSALWDLILVRNVYNFALSQCETCTKLRPFRSRKINPSMHVFCIQD